MYLRSFTPVVFDLKTQLLIVCWNREGKKKKTLSPFLTPVIASFCSLKRNWGRNWSAFQNLFLLSYLWKYHIIILHFFFSDWQAITGVKKGDTLLRQRTICGKEGWRLVGALWAQSIHRFPKMKMPYFYSEVHVRKDPLHRTYATDTFQWHLIFIPRKFTNGNCQV